MAKPAAVRKVIEIKPWADPEAKVYPRSISGIYARWRWVFVWLTQIVFYGLCWLPWRERQAILARVEPMVQRLFTELGDADKVVERVKADASLSTRARQVALQVTLRTSLDRLNTAARQPHP
jgi:hypothetical protein